MPNIDPHEALAARLDALTETVTKEGDPKEQAATALLIAQARKELAQALEVRKRIDQPWWMGRKLEVLIGVVIAAAVIAGYFFTNLRPLLSADEQLALKNAEIAQKQAKIQEIDTKLTQQENERVNKMLSEKEADLTYLRKQLAETNEGFEAQLAKLETKREADLAVLEKKLREAPQRSDERDRLSNQLEAASEALSEAKQALSEASKRTEQLDLPYRWFAFNPEKEQIEIKYEKKLNPNNQITLEAWFKANDLSAVHWIICKLPNPPNAQPYYQYALGLRDGGIYFPLGINRERKWIDGAFKGDLKINEWQHVAATYDGNRMRLYLDGKKWKNNPKISGPINDYYTNLAIGDLAIAGKKPGLYKKGSRRLYEGFKGELAEVRIWNVARTEDQIRAGMNITIQPDEKDLLWSSTDWLRLK